MIFGGLKMIFRGVSEGTPLQKMIGLEAAENKGLYRYITTNSSFYRILRDKFIFANSLPYLAFGNPLADIRLPYPASPYIYIEGVSKTLQRSQINKINELEAPKKPYKNFFEGYSGLYR